MPHVDSLEPKHHAFNILFGQTPLTKVCNYEKSIKVDLIKHDDPLAMMKGTYDFAKATWSLDGRESERASEEDMIDAMDQMLAGKALGLGLETVNFMFRISGITRIDTHQIVRQRIGVTFSQQCSGDQFWNHMNLLIEPSIVSKNLEDSFIKNAIANKMLYAELVDKGISIQAARSILPHCLETFIFMNANLMTLLFFHQKRINDGSQTWQINSVAQQMADEVCKVFPQLKEVFEKNKSKFKFQKEASADRKNNFSTSLYLPVPDEFDYHERDFLYNRTKEEKHRIKAFGLDFPDRFFWGYDEITENQYTAINEIYNQVNEKVRKSHFSNDEIKKLNLEAGVVISEKILKINYLAKSNEEEDDYLITESFNGLFDYFFEPYRGVSDKTYDSRFDRGILDSRGIVLSIGENYPAIADRFNPLEFDHFDYIKNLYYNKNQYISHDKLDDFFSIEETLYPAIHEAKRDKYSRQIVILNTKDFLKRKPCFLSFQFLLNNKDFDFTLIVYQRSADKSKFRGDLEFFGYIISAFQKNTGYNVSDLVVYYGSFHKEI